MTTATVKRQTITAKQTKAYTKKYGPNDIVKMELNLPESVLKFWVNDEYQGIAYNDIVKNNETKYKLGVYIYCRGDAVKLISFKCR